MADFETVLELSPHARHVGEALAGVLAGRGASVAAVREALGHLTPGSIIDGHVVSTALVPMLDGDFVEVRKIGQSLLSELPAKVSENDHWEAIATTLQAYFESGDVAGAAAVASDYLDRRVAWSRPVDAWIGMALGAVVRGKRVGPAAGAKQLDSVLEKLVANNYDASLAWDMTYANASETPREATAAVDKLNSLHLSPPQMGWRGATARALFLGGRAGDARPLLEGTARVCSGALLITRNWMHAHLYLGELDEQEGNKPSACGHYAKVLERWGHAKPRSVTADEARAHAKALGCEIPSSPRP